MTTAVRNKVEISKPLGDRVYKRHRKMVDEVSKKLGIRRAQVVQLAIEELYDRNKKGS